MKFRTYGAILKRVVHDEVIDYGEKLRTQAVAQKSARLNFYAVKRSYSLTSAILASVDKAVFTALW
jgi:hypothetical protein